MNCVIRIKTILVSMGDMFGTLSPDVLVEQPHVLGSLQQTVFVTHAHYMSVLHDLTHYWYFCSSSHQLKVSGDVLCVSSNTSASAGHRHVQVRPPEGTALIFHTQCSCIQDLVKCSAIVICTLDQL